MSTTYVGFYRPAPGAEEVNMASVRDTGAPPQALRDKANAFPASLPATCKLIGS